MKKVVLLFSAVILAAGITFAQTPQDKTSKPATKTETTKDSKSGCDEKTKAACSDSKKGHSCCSKDSKKSAPATTAPEKK